MSSKSSLPQIYVLAVITPLVFAMNVFPQASKPKKVLMITDIVWVNNLAVGEIGLNMFVAASFGVPTIMLSGDTAACREIRALEPKVECAEVKTGVSRNGGFMLSHPAAHGRHRLPWERVVKSPTISQGRRC